MLSNQTILIHHNEEDFFKSLSSIEKKKFLNWKKYAKDVDIDVSYVDYKNKENWNTYKSLFDIRFFETRYSNYDFVKIYKHQLSILCKKRGSMYDPENIAKKNNISIDEALVLSEKRKESTKITLENLIKKHGKEEGTARYLSFLDKSKTSIDNYKKRYGDNWEERWLYFLKTRDSSSLNFHKNKYGDDGQKIFEQQVIKFKKSSDPSYYKETYGDVEGAEILDNINKKKAIGSASSWSFEFFKRKNLGLDEFELRRLFEEKNKQRNGSNLEFYIKKGCSIEEAKLLRLKHIEKIYRNNNSGRNVSKQSIEFFSLLQSRIDDHCYFGSKKEELHIRHNDKNYFFDFFHKQSNTIIEYNGSVFHAPENISDNDKKKWKSRYGLTWECVRENDIAKQRAAIENGYNILIVWDFEVNSKTKKENKINEILNKLKNKGY